jgi:integrase
VARKLIWTIWDVLIIVMGMASVHKDPRFPKGPWYAAFTRADGRRARRSTKTTSRAQARIIAEAWEAAEREAASGDLTRARVGAILEETLLRLGHPAQERVSVEQWLQEWLANKKPMLAPASYRAYSQAAALFLAYLGEKGCRRRLESITERDVEGFTATLRKSCRGAGTINGIRARLGGAFEKARRSGRVPYNPFAAVEAEKSDSRPRATFSPGAIAALCKVASQDWQGAILFAYSTGARLGDCASLRWSNLDIANGVTVFREQKTGKEACIGLHADFIDWLAGRPVPQKTDAFVFPSLAGRQTGGAGGLSNAFMALIGKAGLANPLLREGNAGRGNRMHALSFHSLRHTAASSVFNAAAVRETVRRVTQHAAAGSLGRYLHEDLAAIREAVSLIPRLPL